MIYGNKVGGGSSEKVYVITNKDETILKTVGSAMAELESIVEDEKTANYWIDDTHNIFAFVNNNGDTEDDDK